MGVLDKVEELKKLNEQGVEEEVNQTPTEQKEIEPAIEKPVVSSVLPVNAEPERVSGDIVKTTVQQAMVEKVKEGAQNDMRGLVRDMTYVKGASDLQEDEAFREAYQKELGAQLVQDLKDEGKRAAIVEQSKKQQARNIRDESFFNGCKPIFQLLGIDQAYGLVPMIVTVVLLMIPFLVVSLVRFVINSVNSIFTAIAGFRKPAFWICSIIIVAIITVAVVLGALWLIDTYFGTEILKFTKQAILK